jgi:fumarylacetoacetase
VLIARLRYLSAFLTILSFLIISQDPEPLEYLRNPRPSAYDIHLEVELTTAKGGPFVISKSNLKYMVCFLILQFHFFDCPLQYWTMTQQLAHHTVTGCNMNPGDLLGSGTISGKVWL